MGIIPTVIVFFMVTVANIINTRYLIESNEGLKRRQLPMKNGLKIDNDYANLMYQVRTTTELIPTNSFSDFLATTYSYSSFSLLSGV